MSRRGRPKKLDKETEELLEELRETSDEIASTIKDPEFKKFYLKKEEG